MTDESQPDEPEHLSAASRIDLRGQIVVVVVVVCMLLYFFDEIAHARWLHVRYCYH